MYQILFLVAILLVIESTIRCIVVSASFHRTSDALDSIYLESESQLFERCVWQCILAQHLVPRAKRDSATARPHEIEVPACTTVQLVDRAIAAVFVLQHRALERDIFATEV